MSWTKTTIGEHCTVTSSKRFHLSERTLSGVPFYCSKEIIQKCNGQEITECDHISEALYEEVKKVYGVPEEGDLLVTTRGTIGIPYIYKKEDKFYFADGNLTWLKDFKNTLSSQFLYYWFKSNEGQKKIDAIAKGTAQKAVPIAGIKMLDISLPPIDVQDRIADILSAYDDLIENNQKQIKLLEEAAQRLYKEWFVDLRFPGYEHTPVVDGVPEGWNNGVISDVAVFKRGKTITMNEVNEGNVPVVAGGLEPAYYHDTPNTEAPVITVSGSGANAGFTRMYHTKIWASDCSYVDAAGTRDVFWVYCFLKDNKMSIDALQKGAAQPHVYAKDLNAMSILIPSTIVMMEFQKIVQPVFQQIGNLKEQIEYLIKARCYLLPKLINGEIEV